MDQADFILTRELMDQMLQDVEARLPEEACGLLAGQPGVAQIVLPIMNALHSPARFRLDAREQLDAFLWMDRNELELSGIYHSHPNGPDFPSDTDVREAYYPEAVHLIWSHAGETWTCRAYRIAAGGYSPMSIRMD